MPNELPPIDYQPDASLRAIRRGVRWMVLLTLLNTVLLGATVAGPGLSAFVRQQWAEYQAAKAQRIAQVQAAAAATAKEAKDRASREAAIIAQVPSLTYSVPADTLVFAEDFAPGTLPLRGTTSTSMPVARRDPTGSGQPAGAALPDCLDALPHSVPNYGMVVDPRDAYLFIHTRRARPGDDERLVLFSIEVQKHMNGDRGLMAVSLSPGRADIAIYADRYTRWSLDLPAAHRKPVRFYAGQPDPIDESRWTVPYEYGEARGTLSGRLTTASGFEISADGPLAPYLTRQGGN